MATLRTRVNGVLVTITADGNRFTAETEFSATHMPTYSAPQIFTAGNLAMIDAAFHGYEHLAMEFIDEHGFMCTVADLQRASWEFALLPIPTH